MPLSVALCGEVSGSIGARSEEGSTQSLKRHLEFSRLPTHPGFDRTPKVPCHSFLTLTDKEYQNPITTSLHVILSRADRRKGERNNHPAAASRLHAKVLPLPPSPLIPTKETQKPLDKPTPAVYNIGSPQTTRPTVLPVRPRANRQLCQNQVFIFVDSAIFKIFGRNLLTII